MSQDQSGSTTRRGFLGAASVVTVATLAAPTIVEGRQSGAAVAAGGAPGKESAAPSSAKPSGGAASSPDWTKPAALAIPKEGYFKKEEGRYGPIYPKTPANYGFSIMAKIKPGRESAIRQYGTTIEEGVKATPDLLAVLKLHYLRWVLFNIGNDTYFMYQAIFDTDFDKYTEDAIAIFSYHGINTVFENLEGFPMDWKTNAPAFVEFVRKHQCPSFLEYAEYPYVSADEIKKALRTKASLASMLDQMQ